MDNLRIHQDQALDNRNIHKAARLVWLLMHPGPDKEREADYKEKYTLPRSLSHKDLRIYYPALRKAVEQSFPALISLLRQMITVADLRKLPVTTTKNAALSHLTVDILINHETQTITWLPFTQKIYDAEGTQVASVQYNEGSAER